MTIIDISLEQAGEIGRKIGIEFGTYPKYDVMQFLKGMIVELEHGTIDPQTNITNNDLVMAGMIALAHLKEKRNYYQLLRKYVEND